MYVSVRRYQIKPGTMPQITRLVNDGFVPIVSQAPGFITYYLVEAPNEVVSSISVFETQAGAEASNRMAADWVRANIASLVASGPEVTAGEAVVHK